MGLSQAPKLTLCVVGLCALVLAPRVHTLCHGACVHLSQLPGCTRCVTGPVRTCLSSPGAHAVSRGLCALVSAPRVHTLCHGACAHLSQLPKCTLCVTGLVRTCFSSLCLPSVSRSLRAFVSSCCLHSLCRGLFFLLSAVPGGSSVLPKFACLPSFSTSVPPFAPAVFVCLGPPSVLPAS